MAQDCPTCGARGTYDPKIVKATQFSNGMDDEVRDRAAQSYNSGKVGGEERDLNNAITASSVADQGLKDKLPGMTDYGIGKVKENVRKGIGVGSSSSLQQNAQPKPSGFGRVGSTRGVKGK